VVIKRKKKGEYIIMKSVDEKLELIEYFQRKNNISTDGCIGKLTLKAYGYSDDDIKLLTKIYWCYYASAGFFSIKNEYLISFYKCMKRLIIGE
jgi:hypothetical protein